jgi:formamidopyrimidine-DNA glycosylase
MPELPEVETMVRTLRPRLLGRTFGPARILRASAVGAPAAAAFAAGLAGQTVSAVWRRGKYILIDLQAGGRLVVHLRMTGQLVFRPGRSRPGGHTRAVLPLDGDEALHFIDQRTFGKLYLLPDQEPGPVAGLAALGPEPLDEAFTVPTFAAALARTGRPIKTALLDQALVAGIGNIYADEALFLAAIHPATPARDLDEAAVRRLHGAVREALTEGIRNRGTTFAHFRNAEGEPGGNQAHLAVYGREGEPCPRCGHPLRRLVLGGRSAHFCEPCQPLIS